MCAAAGLVCCSLEHVAPTPVLGIHSADCALQAYFMLDEMLLAGEMQEPSKKASAQQDLATCRGGCCVALTDVAGRMQAITRVIEAQDQLVEQAKVGGPPAPGSK